MESFDNMETVALPNMFWAKFLGFFALWLGAVLNFSTAFMMLSGSIYADQGLTSKQVYDFYGPALLVSDIYYGAVLLLLVFLQVFTAVAIIRKKRIVILLAPLVYFISVFAAAVYTALSSLVVGESTVSFQFVFSGIFSIIVGFINVIYFKKREIIFCK